MGRTSPIESSASFGPSSRAKSFNESTSTMEISNSLSPSYQDPRKGFLSYLPTFFIPYAELMRINKPAGYSTGYFPHAYGTLWASLVNESIQRLGIFFEQMFGLPLDQFRFVALLAAGMIQLMHHSIVKWHVANTAPLLVAQFLRHRQFGLRCPNPW